jgi:hypothetical protein
MRIVLGLLLFVAVTIVTWVLVVAGYDAMEGGLDYHDFEGATAMGVAVGIAPLVALIVGFSAMIWFMIGL